MPWKFLMLTKVEKGGKIKKEALGAEGRGFKSRRPELPVALNKLL